MIATLYHGDGRRRPTAIEDFPDLDPERLRGAEDYLAGPDLRAAASTALALGMPLLLTGEPGSGKSRLAHSLAWELALPLVEFVVKSDTQARDLFYSFDTVGRFHASQSEAHAADPRRFVAFQALGRAILYAKPEEEAIGEGPGRLGLIKERLRHPGRPTRSVVLIDEIDKAPRDVPNDLLVELEHLRFEIPELACERNPSPLVELTGDQRRYRPIVVITSNSEKALPEPFLRRCVYFHLELPPFRQDRKDGICIEDIVQQRLGKRFGLSGQQLVKDLLDFYRYLRRDARGLSRKPSLAELLSWLDALLPTAGGGAAAGSLAELDRERLLIGTKCLLLKDPRDQRQAQDLLDRWDESRVAATGQPARRAGG